MMRSRSIRDLLVSGSTSPGAVDQVGAPKLFVLTIVTLIASKGCDNLEGASLQTFRSVDEPNPRLRVILYLTAFELGTSCSARWL